MAVDHPEHVAAKAQAKLADSAGALSDSAVKQTDSADRRTELAGDRTVLAAERTYAAWVRTGLSALAAGVGAKALLAGVVAPWLVVATSIVLIVFAQFCFVAAVWREIDRSIMPPQPDIRRLPAWALIVFNGFLVIVAGAVVVGMWAH